MKAAEIKQRDQPRVDRRRAVAAEIEWNNNESKDPRWLLIFSIYLFYLQLPHFVNSFVDNRLD